MHNRVCIGVDEWAGDSADLLTFDRRVHSAEDEERGPVAVVARRGTLDEEQTALAARQIRIRYQRCLPMRNVLSRGAAFDRILARHRKLHDCTLPLVRADYDHSLDAWQWVLRLEPGAGLAVQIAALFHDIERLESEATARVEQHAPDLQGFKDA